MAAKQEKPDQKRQDEQNRRREYPPEGVYTHTAAKKGEYEILRDIPDERPADEPERGDGRHAREHVGKGVVADRHATNG